MPIWMPPKGASMSPFTTEGQTSRFRSSQRPKSSVAATGPAIQGVFLGRCPSRTQKGISQLQAQAALDPQRVRILCDDERVGLRRRRGAQVDLADQVERRTPPSEVAARAGEAVRWHRDVAAALAAAEESGKPVFWYVPTVPGSRMDRKPEIDLYMRAGPFSWPGLVALLNEHFEPVREVPGRELAKEHGLQPVAFIEPGFVATDFGGRSFDLRRGDELAAYQPVVTAMMEGFQRSAPNASQPGLIAEVIHRAVTDGSDQLRYPAGADAEHLLAMRAKLDDRAFMEMMQG